MYCVKCGVELGDSEKKCPLCGTVVYHPEVKPEPAIAPFPPNDPEKKEFNKQATLLILSFIFAIPLCLVLICDLSLNSRITWSGYVNVSIILGYLIIVLPQWFHLPNPIIFVSVDFAGLVLVLLYINIRLGGNWFYSFALPVVAALAVITVAVIGLLKYVKRGHLYIFAGAFIATGFLMPFTERLLNLTFRLRDNYIWSFYPLAVLALIGIMLIVIAANRPLRDALRQKFFI